MKRVDQHWEILGSLTKHKHYMGTISKKLENIRTLGKVKRHYKANRRLQYPQTNSAPFLHTADPQSAFVRTLATVY